MVDKALNFIPRVLHGRHKQFGISTERALKQAKELLESFAVGNKPDHDRIEATLDDIDFMLQCLI
jgi:hypothetical protein